MGPTVLCQRVARRLLETGAVKNPLALPPARYAELLPSWAQKRIVQMCGENGAPSEVVATQQVLRQTTRIDLRQYRTVGWFVSTDERFRKRIAEMTQEFAEWSRASTRSCVGYFVSGDPGSGKSFFVGEFAKTVVSLEDLVVESGANCTKPRDLVRRIVERIDQRRAHSRSAIIAFIDEVDTAFDDGYLYGHLYHLVGGARPIDLGSGPNLEKVCWLFAGSCASNTSELAKYAHSLPVSTKMRDFLSRIPPANRIDLPPLSIGPLERIVRAVSMVKRNLPNLAYVDGLILFLLGSRNFESTRELAQIVEHSCQAMPAASTLFAWDSLSIDRDEKLEFVSSYLRLLGESARRQYEVA